MEMRPHTLPRLQRLRIVPGIGAALSRGGRGCRSRLAVGLGWFSAWRIAAPHEHRPPGVREEALPQRTTNLRARARRTHGHRRAADATSCAMRGVERAVDHESAGMRQNLSAQAGSARRATLRESGAGARAASSWISPAAGATHPRRGGRRRHLESGGNGWRAHGSRRVPRRPSSVGHGFSELVAQRGPPPPRSTAPPLTSPPTDPGQAAAAVRSGAWGFGGVIIRARVVGASRACAAAHVDDRVNGGASTTSTRYDSRFRPPLRQRPRHAAARVRL